MVKKNPFKDLHLSSEPRNSNHFALEAVANQPVNALEVQVLADKLQQHVPKGSEEPDGAFGGLEAL